MIAYLTILSTALAAFLGAPIWSVALGAMVLLATSIGAQRKLSTRFASIDTGNVLTMAAWQCAGNAFLASGAAFVLGSLVRVSM